MLGGDYVQRLRTVFDLRDGDGDGELTASEFALLLELMGMEKQEEIDAATHSTFPTGAGAGADATISFASLLRDHRVAVVACAASHPLPREEFRLRCERLKHGFHKLDGDRDSGITRAELEIAIQKLDLALRDIYIDRIFAVLDRDSDGCVEWSDFVYSAYRNTLASVTGSTRPHFSIDMLVDLPTLIRFAAQSGPLPSQGLTRPSAAPSVPRKNSALAEPETPIKSRPSLVRKTSLASSRAERTTATTPSNGRRLSDAVPMIERIGMDYLTRTSMVHLSHSKMAPRQPDTTSDTPRSRPNALRTGFSAAVRRRIRVIEAAAVAMGALAGILCGLLSIWLESLVNARVDDRAVLYYVYIVLVNVGVSVLEVHGMYLTAVVCAFRLTVCTNLKLYPQDAEREFLTRAIARAALQAGHHKDRLFGIDPMKDSPRVVLCMTFLVYKSKRYAVKFLLKLLIKRVLWRAAVKTMLSLLVLPINGVMNAWTIRGVMLNCRVSIIGPPCVVALLETFFLQDALLSPFQCVDCVRVVGAALVCKRSIHPNLEIMVEHLRHQWLKPELWPVTDGCGCLTGVDESCSRHILDSVELLVASLRLYAGQLAGPAGPSVRQHLQNLFALLIIALIIDGSVDWAESAASLVYWAHRASQYLSW